MISRVLVAVGGLVTGHRRCACCGRPATHARCDQCQVGQDDITQYVGQLRRTSWRRADKLRRPIIPKETS